MRRGVAAIAIILAAPDRSGLRPVPAAAPAAAADVADAPACACGRSLEVEIWIAADAQPAGLFRP